MTTKKPTKSFHYDVLIDQDDICDRDQEINTLLKAARNNKKIVLLAPRRYGKTSLVKNVVGRKMEKARPKRLVIFIDLMDVESLHSIAARLEHGFTKALSKSLTTNSLIKRAADFIKDISLQINIDPITGSSSVCLQKLSTNAHKNITTILDGIYALSKKQPLMLILDEFQDIAFVPEAEAIFRSTLQQMSDSAIFMLGSKRHLMEHMLGDSNAPLFQFGDEMSLNPIPEKAWKPYFQERLAPKQISLTADGLHYLLERMCNVPNSICELGAWIQERYSNQELHIRDVEQALNEMVEYKQSYAYRLHGFSEQERTFLRTIAKINFVLKPYGFKFLKQLDLPKSNVCKMLKKFRDNGMLEFELDKGWRLSNPVFAHYLRKMTS